LTAVAMIITRFLPGTGASCAGGTLLLIDADGPHDHRTCPASKEFGDDDRPDQSMPNSPDTPFFRKDFIMRQRMMLLAAAFVGFAITATAQAPLQSGPASKAPVQPVRGGSGAPATPVVVQGCGSCASGGAVNAKHSLIIGAGTINPVGCGCAASERSWMFGSCKQFFNPGNVCGGGCGGGLGIGNRNPCDLPKYGTGLGQPANNCAGPFTYTFR
jgi:hypothetical protein